MIGSAQWTHIFHKDTTRDKKKKNKELVDGEKRRYYNIAIVISVLKLRRFM